jgi:nucleotide-binding universal stress UspA family protein
MFDRILVPLDGSRLAEAALPAAEALRLTFGSSITLIHVLERGSPKETHGELHLSDRQEAEEYLDETARRYFPADAKIERHVHTGGISDVPASLTEHSRELAQDLIIMCVHGRGGISRILAGSLAERTVEKQTVPVLLVRAGAGGPIAPSLRTIIVALDGKPSHEQGLAVAAELAAKTGARLLLTTIVPTLSTLIGERGATGRLLPVATAELLEQTEESAGHYLSGHAVRLAAKGISFEIFVHRGNPPRQIVSLARKTGADLIVVGTHGRTGSKAFWAGSMAHKIVGATAVPVLLVPAARKEEE